MVFGMRYIALFLLIGAALATVADSSQLKSEDNESKRILQCKKIRIYRTVLPMLNKFWEYLIQKFRCREKKSSKKVELNCGIRRTEKSSIVLKIAGGKDAVENSWPWQVSIFMGNKPLGEECGGTLIADDWVLTSASCIKYRRKNQTNAITVRVGDHHILRKDDHEQTIEVSKVIQHPKFKDERFENRNDIALLRLKRKVSLNDRINVACIPSENLNLAAGTRCTVLGWGMKEKGHFVSDFFQINFQLQEIEMSVLSHQSCEDKLFRSNVMSSMHICAAGEDGKATRGGDIGVPLLCPKINNGRKHWYLAGVFSFGIQNSGRKYEVFTRVSTYSDWIKRVQRMNAN